MVFSQFGKSDQTFIWADRVGLYFFKKRNKGGGGPLGGLLGASWGPLGGLLGLKWAGSGLSERVIPIMPRWGGVLGA